MFCVAIVFIYRDEASRIAERRDSGYSFERRRDHGELEWDLITVLEPYLAGRDFLNRLIRKRLDVPLGELILHEGLRIAEPAHAHVAEVGFGGEVENRHFMPQFPAAKLCVHLEGQFIRRAEARDHLRRAEDYGPGIFQDLLPGFPGLHRMVEREGAGGVSLVRPEAGNLVKSEVRAR